VKFSQLYYPRTKKIVGIHLLQYSQTVFQLHSWKCC